MNTLKVDLILQYILAVASENDWDERDLSNIHLIKYIYLADLNYARRCAGRTYTGIDWQFFRFGPWSAELNRRIEPALLAIGAEKKVIESTKFEDFTRWSVSNQDLIPELENKIDTMTALAIKGAVKRFKKDTESLLHHVYQTGPMLYAAPGEYLDFSKSGENYAPLEDRFPAEDLTARQIKKRKIEFDRLKKGFQERLIRKREEVARRKSRQPAPRYDEVFLEGVKTLEKLAGPEIPSGKITCSFSEHFWKSKARYDPEIP